MPGVAERRTDEGAVALERRNRRTALVLVGWIALLAIVSVIVIWVRN